MFNFDVAGDIRSQPSAAGHMIVDTIRRLTVHYTINITIIKFFEFS